ncbi:hypothetical protein CEXT_487111 [Caerostris extrusa]|uniref:Uncharacterized protein n=1 Tax=Caerostris extrusa TaxID=172846 RepID=A0AAV4MH29_CAEEX|nr:hypothetical protein CEXT_487111 [Caerostris extrusa]
MVTSRKKGKKEKKKKIQPRFSTRKQHSSLSELVIPQSSRNFRLRGIYPRVSDTSKIETAARIIYHGRLSLPPSPSPPPRRVLLRAKPSLSSSSLGEPPLPSDTADEKKVLIFKENVNKKKSREFGLNMKKKKKKHAWALWYNTVGICSTPLLVGK